MRKLPVFAIPSAIVMIMLTSCGDRDTVVLDRPMVQHSEVTHRPDMEALPRVRVIDNTQMTIEERRRERKEARRNREKIRREYIEQRKMSKPYRY